MQTRKIKPEERVTSDMIATLAFLDSVDYTEKLKDPSAHSDGYENIWATFTDDDIMTSRMNVIPYTVMFDGHEVLMAGIGGVASLPEYRNAGGIRSIFIEAMKEMKEKGQIFSYLYPFSHKYYRKFGYELCFNRQTVMFPVSELREKKPAGSLSFFHKDSDIGIYMDIYKRFISGMNLAVVRSENKFREFINKDPYVTKQYTYLWNNDSNEAKSYITFTAVAPCDEGAQMKIQEFAWIDEEGLSGMLSCLGRFDAQYSKIYWEAPDTINLYSLLSEPYDINITLHCGGMNRIIDVKKVLELMKPPYGEGSAVISVNDDFLSWNNKTFKITWQNDNKLNVCETDDLPDTEVSVQTLVQLVCGYFTPDTAEKSGQLKIHKNRENLNRLFFKKNLFITDRF